MPERAPVATRCERATVRSRAARSYAEVQGALDRGDASPSLALLREIGEHLLDRERERGGVSIAAPGQEVVRDADGSYSLELEAPLPVETWNAQISLLTGREAARLMVGGRRRAGAHAATARRRDRRPPPPHGTRARRRVARRARRTPTSCAGSDPTTRARATFLLQALHALRGAGYAVVTPGSRPRRATRRSVRRYAHVTAPLRRLADRFANEVVLAVAGGYAPPAWAVDALPGLVDGDAACRPARGRGRPGLHRRGRGRDPRAARGLDVSRPRWSTVTGAASWCCSPTCPSWPPWRATPTARRRGDGQARGTGSGGADVDVLAAASLTRVGRLDRGAEAEQRPPNAIEHSANQPQPRARPPITSVSQCTPSSTRDAATAIAMNTAAPASSDCTLRDRPRPSTSANAAKHAAAPVV